MTDQFLPQLMLLGCLRARAAHGWAHRHADVEDGGLGTLELVIITLGLVTVAGVLVAAITAAVTSRTSQIK
jgi:hypothetical protein